MQVEQAGRTRRLRSFNDRSLASALFLVDLLAAVDPACINFALVTPGSSPQERETNAKYVISTAKKLGCSVYLVWEDIVEVNHMVVVFVASIMLHCLHQERSSVAKRAVSPVL